MPNLDTDLSYVRYNTKKGLKVASWREKHQQGHVSIQQCYASLVFVREASIFDMNQPLR